MKLKYENNYYKRFTLDIIIELSIFLKCGAQIGSNYERSTLEFIIELNIFLNYEAQIRSNYKMF